MTGHILLLEALVLAGIVLYGTALLGWRRFRYRRVDVPRLPMPVPTGNAELVGGTAGTFVGTSRSADWIDRFAIHHGYEQATAVLVVGDDGVHVFRSLLPEMFIPYTHMRDVRIERSLADRVGSGGLLVITWRLAGRTLASGFRPEDGSVLPRLLGSIRAFVPAVAS
jgi:hypothetical protein